MPISIIISIIISDLTPRRNPQEILMKHRQHKAVRFDQLQLTMNHQRTGQNPHWFSKEIIYSKLALYVIPFVLFLSLGAIEMDLFDAS